MQRPRVRFTVRRMLVVVAVAGVAIAGFVETRRCLRLRAEYQRQAASHVRSAASHRRAIALAEKGKATASRAAAQQEQQIAKVSEDARKADDPAIRATYFQIALYTREWHDHWTEMALFYGRIGTGHQELADYHAGLARKYRLAAGRPWSPVAPDPPEPNDLMRDGALEEPKSPAMRLDF